MVFIWWIFMVVAKAAAKVGGVKEDSQIPLFSDVAKFF
jgi:hypothetical protein